MTHREFVMGSFEVVACTNNAILYWAYGELCCEINGESFDCHSKEEFYEMVELFGDDDFVE